MKNEEKDEEKVEELKSDNEEDKKLIDEILREENLGEEDIELEKSEHMDLLLDSKNSMNLSNRSIKEIHQKSNIIQAIPIQSDLKKYEDGYNKVMLKILLDEAEETEENKPKLNILNPPISQKVELNDSKLKVDFPNQINPIPFVDQFENDFICLEKQNSFPSITQISYFNTNKKEIKRISFDKLEKIEEIYFQSKLPYYLKAVPTSICNYNNFIFIGNSQGVVRIFNNHFVESQPPIKDNETLETSVTCLDSGLVDKRNILIIGNANGIIIVYDLNEKRQLGKLKIHFTQITFLKLISKGKYIFFSCDSDGNCKLVEESKKIIVGISFNSISISQSTFLSSASSIFISSNPLTLENGKQLLVLGDSKELIIYSLIPTLTIKEKIKRYDDSIGCPYFHTWGKGALPESPTNQNWILAIYFDQIIQLIEVFIDEKGEERFLYNGFYISENEISFFVFLDYSILFIITKSKEAILLSTAKFSEGKYYDNRRSSFSIANNFAEITSPLKIEDELISQKIEDKMKNSIINIYQTTAINLEDRSILITRTKDKYSFTRFKLLSWEQYANELKLKGEWIIALSYALDVYRGNIIGFSQLNDLNREEKLREYFKEFLLNCVIDRINKLKSMSEKVIDEIGFIIEFSIETQICDFLFSSILNKFAENNIEGHFFQALEVFILKGQFYNELISDFVIKKIISFYENNKNINKLEKVILNLNIKNSDREFIGDITKKYNLLSAYMYVKTANESVNNFKGFIDPLNMLIVDYKQKYGKSFELAKFVSLDKCIFPTLKQYTGYKIFWYLDLCLKGEKYPRQAFAHIPIHPQLWPNIIYLLIKWVLAKENYEELIKFDIKLTFYILIIFFEDPKISEFIINSDKYNVSKDEVLDFPTMINEIRYCCGSNLENDENYFHYLSIFTSSVSGLPYIQIQSDYCIKAASYILKSDKVFFNLKCIDKIYSNDEIEEMVLAMIKRVNNLSQKDLVILLNSSINSPYNEVLSNLYEIQEDYVNCFKSRINIKKKEAQNKIFEWVESKLVLLKDKKDIVEDIKLVIKDHIFKLFQINPNGVVMLFDKWFENGHEIAMSLLEKENSFQLQYIQNLIKIKENEIKNVMLMHQQGNEKESKNYLIYKKILISHIQLLCNLDKNNVIDALKGKSYYPIQECTTICILSKAFEAAAYLLRKQNNYHESLSNYINKLQEIFDLNIAEKSQRKKQREKFENCFNGAIKVCNNYTKSLELIKRNLSNELWFILLDKIYEFWNRIYKSEKATFSINGVTMKLVVKIKSINNCIRKIIEDMSHIIPLHEVISQIAEKHQELDFHGFKTLFKSMLKSSEYKEKILNNILTLLSLNFKKQFTNFVRQRSMPNIISEWKCLKCNKQFNFKKKSLINLFQCGHQYHNLCVSSDNQCPICLHSKDILKMIDIDIPEEQNGEITTTKELKKEAKNEEEIANDKENDDEIEDFNSVKEGEFYRKIAILEKSFSKSFSLIMNTKK